MIEIVREPIDLNRVINSVKDSAAGGTVIFIGTVRNHSSGRSVQALEYQAYESMALRMIEDIALEAKKKWGVLKISAVHRVGMVGAGEAGLVVVVSTVHRKEAFEACRYVIDAIKKDVPVWKKEITEGGGKWSVRSGGRKSK